MNLNERFNEYLKDNPHIFPTFVSFSLQMKRSGRNKYSHWVIVNRMRWDIDIKAIDTNSEFKISNDYIALLARKAMKEYPELAGFFNIKEMKRS